jgi:MFS family permease
MQNSSQSKNPQFLYISAWLTQMSIGILGITLPIYAYKLGASIFLIGLIGAAYGLTYSFMPLIFGALCEVFSRKTLISLSLVIYAAISGLYLIVHNPMNLVFLRLIESAANAMFWPSVESLLADSVQQEDVRKTLKKFNVSWGSSTIFGPLLAGVMISTIGLRTPFLVVLATSMCLSVVTVMFLTPVSTGEKAPPQPTPSTKNKDESSLAFSTIFMFAFYVGILMSLFPVFLISRGISPYEVGILFLVFSLTRTITFWQVDKIGSNRDLALLSSSIVFVFSAMLIAFSSRLALFAASLAIAGIAAGVAYSISLFIILGRSGSRGLAAGRFESVIGLGFFIGPLLGGYFGKMLLTAPYLLAAALSAAMLILQLTLLKRNRRTD